MVSGRPTAFRRRGRSLVAARLTDKNAVINDALTQVRLLTDQRPARRWWRWR